MIDFLSSREAKKMKTRDRYYSRSEYDLHMLPRNLFGDQYAVRDDRNNFGLRAYIF